MGILKANERFEMCARGVMDSAAKEFSGDACSFMCMDEDTFKALQAVMQLADAALDLQRETAKILNDTNKKVDELNKKLSRLESKVH